MIERIKKISENRLVSNFSYLAIIEIARKILPLVTIPYIVAIIGVEKFGLITFAYAIMTYFQLLVDYGFNEIGTKNVSLKREDKESYSGIFWSIIVAKSIMLILSLTIFLIMLYTFNALSSEKLVFIFSLGLVFGQILFPIWFFQGMEEMKYIAIFSIISRIIYTLSIFIFIQEESDYILIPLLNSISLMLIGISSIYFIMFKFKIQFVLPRRKDIVYYYKEGWHLFLSYVTNNLYTTTNTILLGAMINYNAVGVYSLAATVSGAFLQITGQFNQVIYPHLAKYSEDIHKLREKTRKFLKLFLVILTLLTAFLWLFSDIIIGILFGSEHTDSILILQVLSLTLILSSLGGFYTRYMIIASKQKIILKITFLTMILNFVIIVPFIILFQGLGVAFSKVIVESYQVFLNTKNNKEIVRNLFKKDSHDIQT